ncbi:hypothetical protein [Mycolicibacterium palauense]|uniref:hypothetical protein n=1 Tax=Mycolicibacterium palauense TaxID=2034511 RepID=UPI00114604C8|nr:hypothetical protein [Mycolicibacterium palauense]
MSMVKFNAEEAEAFLRDLAYVAGHGLDLGTLPQVYRRARVAAHPDRNGGDRSLWNKVDAAAEVLTAAGVL